MTFSVSLTAWVLVSTLTLPGGNTVRQDIRLFPTQDACEQTRQQIAASRGASATTLTLPGPQTGTTTTVRQTITWACQRVTDAQGE
jgi:hypothetical protein